MVVLHSLLAGLVTSLLAVLLILLAIPLTVVASYVPASLSSHKAFWILVLAAGVFAAAAMTWWLWHRSGTQDQSPLPVTDPAVVVGEIPRKPVAFVARATVDGLAAAADSDQVAVLCAVTGMRGVGKTQIAAAYARNCGAAGYGLVGWVNAETRDVLLTGLARIADRLGVADPEGDSDESARRLREHLENRAGKSLLVFDNAVGPDILRPFLPPGAARRSWSQAPMRPSSVWARPCRWVSSPGRSRPAI